MSRDVFVSYSQPDRDCALMLVECLEAHGISVWIAPRDVSPSEDWAAEIIDAIAASKIMVLVFSSSSNGSGQVRREVERAIHKGVRVLPFRIEDVLPSKSLEYFLSTQHWMDAFVPPLGPHVERLCVHLSAAIAGSSVVAGQLAPDNASAPKPKTVTIDTRAEVPVAAGMPDAAQLRSVESELARFIGPLAGHLVRRAVQAGGDLQQIVARLAGDIDAAADRAEFLQACRRLGGSGV